MNSLTDRGAIVINRVYQFIEKVKSVLFKRQINLQADSSGRPDIFSGSQIDPCLIFQ